MAKQPGLIELLVAGCFGCVGLTFFAAMQTRQPYALTQIRFCPQSANHPSVLQDNIDRINRERERRPQKNFLGQAKQSKPVQPKYFDEDGQQILDERFCHKPRFVLTEEWERYGQFGSKIPYKGIAISRVKSVPVDNPKYAFFNFGAVLSLWGVTGCVMYRTSKLKRRDFEFSEQEKTTARNHWLFENKRRQIEEYEASLDLEITKEVKDQKHQMMREELGVADTENEAIRNRLQLETVMLSRQAHHAKLQKEIAENVRDAAKADVERARLQKKGLNNDGDEITDEKTIKKQGTDIVEAVNSFGLSLDYLGATTAPAIVRHRFKFGKDSKKQQKLADLEKLAEDLALHLAIPDTPRIVRDKGEIIVEVPRVDREFPHINDTIKSIKKPDGDSVILIGGIGIDGELMLCNVLESPDCHGLGAGATKSGKTQGLYAQIATLISMYSPSEVQLAIYDGKNSLILPESLKPWLFSETALAAQGGEFIQVIEQERKERLTKRAGYRDVTEFNADNPDERLPYIVVLMDEYSVDREYFEGNKNDPDSNIMKQLGKLARSEGIHLFAYDQSAKDENISNRVKENLGARFIYRMVDAKCSSYLEVTGAHKLLGKGDLIVRWEGREYRCQMPNCSPKDLELIANKRVEELNISIDDASPKSFDTAPGESYDPYEFLQNLALQNGLERAEVESEWVRLMGTQPTKEQLDIFMENLAVLRDE